jgi:hypothetical protein
MFLSEWGEVLRFHLAERGSLNFIQKSVCNFFPKYYLELRENFENNGNEVLFFDNSKPISTLQTNKRRSGLKVLFLNLSRLAFHREFWKNIS